MATHIISSFKSSFWAKLFRVPHSYFQCTEILSTGLNIKYNNSEDWVFYRDLSKIDIKQGVFWNLIVIHKNNSHIIILNGLSKPHTNTISTSIKTAWREYQIQVDIIEAGLAKLTDVHKQVLSLFAGNFYIANHMVNSMLKVVATIDDLISLNNRVINEYPTFKQIVDYLKRFVADHASLCKNANQQFVTNEIHDYRKYLNTVEKQPLTEMQARAVITHEDNTLTVAGAGSGKTSVMVAKTGYLLKKSLATTESILLLAYNRKAAEELSDRIETRLEKKVEVKTFHSLGLAIISQVEGKKPSLSKLAEDTRALDQYIQKSIEDLIQDSSIRSLILTYFQSFFAPYRSQFDFKTLGEYYQYIKAYEINNRTLKGDLCKSFEECEIMNYLYLNGIAYEYERDYPVDVATVDYRQYKPDFFLPDLNVYIEHFALKEDGSTPSFIDQVKYHEGVNWKRQLHQHYGTHLWETYSYQKTKGTLIPLLEQRLTEAGAKFQPIPVEKALNKLRDSNKVSDLASIISTFLHQFKANGLTLASLRKQAKRRRLLDNRLQVFLQIFEPILFSYEQHLRHTKELDFEDMIVRAAEYAASGQYRSPFNCILVDEFQDISLGRANLLKALTDQQPGHRLFCVGDDWQAIYRFAGSDIALMRNFTAKFGYTETIKLDKTFRFNDRIEKTGTHFILKNPNQISKKIETIEKSSKPCVFVHRPQKKNDQILTNAIKLIEDNFLSKGLDRHGSVMLLGRYRFEGDGIVMQELKTLYPALKFEFSTVHKAKGLEADYVVILGMRMGRYGFPSEIVDDPLIDAVLAEQETYQHAEERRLFYVALTRAKHQVHIISDRVAPSGFIEELSHKEYDVVLLGFANSIVYCPTCETGQLIQQTSRFGVFYSCNNFPLCNYKTNPCLKCGTGLMRMEVSKKADVCTNNECGFIQPICPRCKVGRLTERHGAHGAFLGCTLYAKGSCSYTQKIIPR